MNVYHNYGIRIASDIPLPMLTPCDTEQIDLEIKKASLSQKVSQPLVHTDFFTANENEILIYMDENAKIMAKNGNQLLYDVPNHYPTDKLCAYLISSGIGAILTLRKTFVIHGNALHLNGKTFLVMGRSGAGKSTTTAAFLQQGAQIIAEDVTPLDIQAEQVCVIPGQSYHKLKQDTLQLLDIEEGQSVFTSPMTQKQFIAPAENKICRATKTLDAIFWLTKQEERQAHCHRLSALDALWPIRCNTYAYRFIKGVQDLPLHFKQVTRLAERIPCFALTRPSSGNSVAQVLELIEARLAVTCS